MTLTVVGKSGKQQTQFAFHAESLLAAAGTVAFSWLIEFTPLVIFGSVFGLSFRLLFLRLVQGRKVRVGVCSVFAVGLLSWLGFSFLDWSHKKGYFAQIASAIAIATSSSRPMSVLVLRLLERRKLLERNRPAAFIAFAWSVYSFVLVATNPSEPIW